jgi:hypothetical protein
VSRILNLRGTSGAGKSYIVRQLMSHYTPIKDFVDGRKQPIGYLCNRPDGPSLYVVGHYEIDCGGADTISKGQIYNGVFVEGADLIFAIIVAAIDRQWDVVYEGLMISSDVTRCIDLKTRGQLLVIGLTTPLAECNAAVDARRAARAERRGRDAAPLKLGRDGTPKNSQAKFKALLTQRARFKDAGVDFRALNRADALRACLEFLSLPLTADPGPSQTVSALPYPSKPADSLL